MKKMLEGAATAIQTGRAHNFNKPDLRILLTVPYKFKVNCF